MKHVLLLGILAIALGGCVKNNPEPVWIEINEWTLQSNPNSVENPGFLSHNFSDAWVYVDNKLIGVFQLPCKIPVILSGENKSIRIYPTVRNNGIQATKKIYPFVEPFEQNYDLVPGETITIDPTTRYYSICNFWLEDFESSSVKIATDENVSNADMTYENSSAIAISGKYGHVALTTTDSLWVGVSTEILDLPAGQEVYLEIDYRNTVSILTGVLGILSDLTPQDNPNISMNAQDVSTVKWKKIYIDLKEIVSYSVNAIGFKQYLRTLLPEGTASGDIYIDNIRLVYY